MGRLGKSVRAVLVATVVILAVGFVFSAIQPVYEWKVLGVMSSAPVSPERAAELLFWPALVFILVSTVITFGVGGYLAGRLAGGQPSKHALLAASIPLLLTWSVVLAEPNPALLNIGFVTIVGVAAAIVLGFLGNRRATDR